LNKILVGLLAVGLLAFGRAAGFSMNEYTCPFQLNVFTVILQKDHLSLVYIEVETKKI